MIIVKLDEASQVRHTSGVVLQARKPTVDLHLRKAAAVSSEGRRKLGRVL